MGNCGCGGGARTANRKWVYTDPETGVQTTHTNEVNARAQQIRVKNSTGKMGSIRIES